MTYAQVAAGVEFQARRLLADDAIIVSIVHSRIGCMPPMDRRNPGRSRFGASDATVAIGIPLPPSAAGLLLRGLRLLARGRSLARASCA